jgi:hypothetical protein
MMKKTLVALAAVAVTGGAFAQSVLTGDFAYGFSSSTANQVTTSGMGLEWADIYINTSESIEGLGTLAVSFGLASDGGKGSNVYTGDHSMTLTMASGVKIKAESAQGASYLAQGLASAGSAYEANLSGKLLSTRSNNDAVIITMPVAEGVSIVFAHADADNTVGIGSGSSYAASSTEALQATNTVSLKYAAGALSVDAGYRAYDSVTASSTSSVNTKNRASVSYDLGVAKIGAGVDQNNYAYGNIKTQSAAGINVPLGAASIGAQFATVQTTGNSSSTSNYTRNGSIFGAKYDLSKRTYLVGQYWSYDAGNTTNTSGYFVGLFNSF